MFEDFSEYSIFIKPGATDMRKQINSLASLSETEISDDVFSKKLFLFCNQSKTHLKILYWDRNGFCLWHKRLEEDRFRWPNIASDIHEISREEFRWLLLGLDFYNAHKIRSYASVV